jgi:hypothetical protein
MITRRIGSTSSRSATRVATPATGSVSGSAEVADDADAHKPSASANGTSGASSGSPVARTKYVVAPATAPIVTMLSKLAASSSVHAARTSRPSAMPTSTPSTAIATVTARSRWPSSVGEMTPSARGPKSAPNGR